MDGWESGGWRSTIGPLVHLSIEIPLCIFRRDLYGITMGISDESFGSKFGTNPSRNVSPKLFQIEIEFVIGR